jgi:N,N-dimethylformamidase beta subunit-like, C-terminal
MGDPINDLPAGLRVDPAAVQGRNFERLSVHDDWLRDWTHVVSGRFSASPYSGLLFYAQSEGVAEFYETDGRGGISLLRQHEGWRETWALVVPGIFGPSGFSGLLLYDRDAGFGAIYDSDGSGGITLLSEDDSWRTTWTHIVAASFTDSPHSALLFYDRANGFGAFYATDGAGRLTLLREYDDWRTTWANIVAGEFFNNGAVAPPVIADLFFQEDVSGYAETWANDGQGNIELRGSQEGLPLAAAIVPGNFGMGVGWTTLLMYERAAGRGVIYSQDDAASGTWSPGEEHMDWRTTWDAIVPGNFWMADDEDTKFWMGDGEHRNEPEGGFTDLLFYEGAGGQGEFYMHEPPLPTVVDPLAGYVSSGSVLPGETITFHVSSHVGRYQIRIYRQDLDLVPVADVEVTADPAPRYIMRTAYRDGAGWPAVATFTVPDDWPSALYLARLFVPPPVIEPSTGPANSALARSGPVGFPPPDVPPYDIPFVVRAAQPGSTSRILVLIPDATYEAYNSWGGRSLYGYGHEGGGHAYAYPQTALRLPYTFRVSSLRPHTGQADHVKRWQVCEVPFLRWLRRQGIAVEVCTAADLHWDSAPALLGRYRLVVSVGHSEYWSKAMRDHVESFVAHGGHAAFFGANNCWWQVRFEDEHTMVCYKQARFDPDNPDRPETVTVNWFDDPVDRPETGLTGVSYFASPISFPPREGFDVAQFEVQEPGHWVFEGTGLGDGEMFGRYDESSTVVGSEMDRRQESTPDSFRTLAAVFIEIEEPDGSKDLYEGGTMGIFQKGSGTVFTASTIDWAKGLSQDSGENPMDVITRNVLRRLG